MSTATEMIVEILSPEKSLFKGEANALVLPGRCGYMTILPGHAKLIAELSVGVLEVSQSGQSPQKYFISGGFVEVQETLVRVLVDVIEKPTDINIERAKKSEQRASERLSGKYQSLDSSNVDYARANAALARAQGRIALVTLARH